MSCSFLGSPLQFSSFWTSAVMRLKIESEDYDLFLGRNLSSVMEMYKQSQVKIKFQQLNLVQYSVVFVSSQATWFYTALPWRSKDVKLNPFEESCVGVFAKDKYTMSLHQYRVNYWLVIFLDLSRHDSHIIIRPP